MCCHGHLPPIATGAVDDLVCQPTRCLPVVFVTGGYLHERGANAGLVDVMARLAIGRQHQITAHDPIRYPLVPHGSTCEAFPVEIVTGSDADGQTTDSSLLQPDKRARGTRGIEHGR